MVVLVYQLAREFDDAQIARILNKQGRRCGLGSPFTQQGVTERTGGTEGTGGNTGREMFCF
jgi:hypothetical protein